MATQSNILAWRIPWTEEPRGLQPWGHKELTMIEQLNNNNKSQNHSFGQAADISISIFLILERDLSPSPSVGTLSDEVPHGTAVSIEEFKDDGSIIRVRADIYCEKASHKGIIIGKNGETLKRIGSYAREDLERFFGVQVYINLWVKVKEKWRDNTLNLSSLGFNLKEFK